MQITKYWFGIIIVFLLSCESLQLNTDEIKTEQNSYYDIIELVNRQIEYLDNASPKVHIIATVNDSKEERVVSQSDSTFWAKTLNLLKKADINQPALQGVFLVKDTTSQVDTSKKLKSYYPKEKKKTDILYLNVYYDSTMSNIQYLETLVRDKNLLYETEKKIKLSFGSYQGHSIVNQYELSGKQKIIFGDTVFFTSTVIPEFQD